MAIQARKLFNQKKHHISVTQQINLLEQIAQLFDQGYSIIEALNLLKMHYKWEYMLKYLIEQLELGRAFDEILDELEFDPRIVTFIFFALQHGNLASAIKQSVQFINQQLNLFEKFKQSIRYPIVLSCFFLIILFFIDMYVYPAFLNLHTSNFDQASLLLFSIKIVDVIFYILYLLLIALTVIVILWIFVKNKLPIRQKAKLLNCVTFSSSYVKKYFSLMFTIHLSSLLKAELSLKASLTLIANYKKDHLLGYYCSDILADLELGRNLAQSLRNNNYFEPNLTLIFDRQVNLSVLQRDLQAYSIFSLKEIQSSMMKLIKRIQPTVFIIIAVSIILIYLSILLPMLNLIQTI